MPLPSIVIVGRPNVGKSSLTNLIAHAKASIVDPTPGVTRDRVAVRVTLDAPDGLSPPKLAEVIDTGGFGAYAAPDGRFNEVGDDLHALTADIEAQIAAGVRNADLVLFVIDAQMGLTPQDIEIATMLRQGTLGAKRGGKKKKGKEEEKELSAPSAKVVVVANKVDGPRFEPHAHEASALGFGRPLMVSAKNNYMRREFLDAVYELLPAAAAQAPEDLPRLAIVGQRNAGKSTLVNALAGEERVIVSEIAGTTRDAIDVRVEIDGRPLLIIDTAGLRKKKSMQNAVEWYALDRLQRSVRRADVVMLLIDATRKLSQVDEHLAQMAAADFKPTVILVNKWDLARGGKDHKGKPITTEHYEKYLRAELKALTNAPIAFISAKEGLNLAPTIRLALELLEQASTRVGTGVLNRVVRSLVDGPTDKKGRQPKIYYVSQTGTRPPTITMWVNDPELFRVGYVRSIMNKLRENSPFAEVPIRLNLKPRAQREETAKGGRAAPAAGEDAESYFDDAEPITKKPLPPRGGTAGPSRKRAAIARSAPAPRASAPPRRRKGR